MGGDTRLRGGERVTPEQALAVASYRPGTEAKQVFMAAVMAYAIPEFGVFCTAADPPILMIEAVDE